jgi:YHS domain-containing protein
MKNLKLFAVVLTALFAVSFSLSAEETKKESEPVKQFKKQTHCPVMGGKIDSTVYTDIQGQRVYHCCPMCSGELKKNPDKYFKKASEEGILFENIQGFCPVSGKELKEKNAYLDFEGRRVYFCCEGCFSSFKDDPQKYLTKLDTPVEESDTGSDQKKSHEGHNH